MEHGRGGGGEDPFRDGGVDVGDLPLGITQLLLHGPERGRVGALLLLPADGIRDGFNIRAGKDLIHQKVDDFILQDFLPDGFLTAAQAALVGLAGVIIVGSAGFAGSGIPDHRPSAMSAEGFPGEQEIIRGSFIMA